MSKKDATDTTASTGEHVGTAAATITQALSIAAGVSTAGSIAGVALSMGGIVGTGLSYYLTNRAMQRVEEAIRFIGTRLDSIQSSNDLTDEILEEIFHILRETAVTASGEKRRALFNAAVSSVIADTDEITRHRLNRAAVELIPAHIKLLLLAYEQTYYRPYSPHRPASHDETWFSDQITLAALQLEWTPENAKVKIPYTDSNRKGLLFDLHRLGMIADENEGTMDGVGSDLVNAKITEYGLQFLDWIADISEQSDTPPDR